MRNGSNRKGSRSFQYRRLLKYLLFALLPLLVLCGMILQESHRWAVKIAEQNAQDMLDKNYELIDQYFESLCESVYLLASDPALINTLARTTYAEPMTIKAAQRDLINICPQYFYMTNNMESVYIVSPDYSLCYVNKSGLPTVIKEADITIAPQIRKANGTTIWFPTHNLVDTLGLSKRYESYYSNKCQVFTIGFTMPMSYVKSGYTYTYSGKGNPLVLVNVYPAVFDQWLVSEHMISDTRYTIVDQSGTTVYTSGDGEFPLSGDQIPRGTSGSATMYAAGKGRANSFICSRTFIRNGWTIASVTNIASTYSGLNIGVIALIVILITSVFTALVAFLSTRSVAKPLEILSGALEETAQANFDYRITDMRHKDYQATFEAYNDMNEHVTKLIHENYEIMLNEKNLEIQLINMQFNPHFLYNTLNIISLMALASDQEEISDIICRLSYMMRYSSKTPSALVPFQDDLNYIEAYVALMKLRFSHPFSYERAVDEEILRCEIPKFLLQPFIENAILHGFSEVDHSYTLRLTGRISGDDLFFTVEDNGKGMPREQIETLWKKESTGIGILNSTRRIKLYYGEAYGVTIESREGEGTRVTLHIAKQCPNSGVTRRL